MESAIYKIETLDRWDDLRAFFGRRYLVSVFAYDTEERRYRPAPFVLIDSFAHWQWRATSMDKAKTLGESMVMEALFRDNKARTARTTSTYWSNNKET